jgi:hypothetical protein
MPVLATEVLGTSRNGAGRNSHETRAHGHQRTQLLPLVDGNGPDDLPREQCEDDIHHARVSGNKRVIVLDNTRWEACALQVPIPALVNGPALYPLQQPVGAQHKVHADDDEPDKGAHPAAVRDAQQRDGERRLAPAGGEDGAEAGCGGIQREGLDGVVFEILLLPAQSVGGPCRLQGDRDDECDL